MKSDGELWAAGYNGQGQLGDGTTVSRMAHVKITGGVRTVVAGVSHTLFIKTDASLWGSGANWWSELGGTAASSVPVPIATDVVAAAAGGSYSLYLKSNGTLWGLGANYVGQLGDGTTTTRATPVQIASSVVSVSAAAGSSFFIKADGTLWAMGENLDGQLGDGTRTNRLTPVLVATSVSSVSAAGEASFFIKRDRTLWGIGSNRSGRLGLPILQSRSEPAEIQLGVPSIDALSIPVGASVGGTVQLSSEISGDGPFSYQWRKNGTPIAGATGSGYLVGVVKPEDGGIYDVVVTGSSGSTISSTGHLTILNAPPVITSALSATAQTGTAFEYRITANNDAYTFSASGLPAGLSVDSSTGRISGTPQDVAGSYAVTIAAGNGQGATQATLQLGLIVPMFAPSIATHPVNQTTLSGGHATFSIAASGTPSPIYQWQVSPDGIAWTNIVNGGVYSTATDATLNITGATMAMSGYRYRCGATNSAGSVISNAAMLTVTVSTVAPAITTQPANQTILSGTNVSFTIAANGVPSPTFQWQMSADGIAWMNVTNGTVYLSTTSETLTITAATLAMNGNRYRCVATNTAGSVTSNSATLSVTSSILLPIFVTQPGDRTILEGANTSFVVTATGTPSPTFRWQVSLDGSVWASLSDGGVYSNVNSQSLTIAGATVAMDGFRYRCLATNSAGTAGSNAATLNVSTAPVPVTGSAAHAVMGDGYIAGGTVTITNTLTYTGTATGLSWHVILPEGWSYISGGGSEGDTKPSVGTTGTVEWAWATMPANPVSFTYTLAVPATSTGAQQLAAITVVTGVPSISLLVKPDPLVVPRVPMTHSADTNSNWTLSLLELARVIEIYNTRNSGTRTGCYVVQNGSEDGFAPEPARSGSSVITLARYHSADTDQNGKLSLLELARVIELYNERTAGARSGFYHLQAGTEDGFAPGM